jgi:endonuclease-8
MPEGDTLFRIATTLNKALAGARVTKFASGRLQGSPAGERIEGVTARGKNLLIRFEKGRTLRTHLMLHGAWHLYREGERWQRPAFLARVELHADNGFVAVCFAAPVVEWLRPEVLADLGPDATTDAFDATSAQARLRALPPETLAGDALLTQQAMSGVGNVIKCEALFICRQDPFAPLASVTDAALSQLVAECHRLLVANRDSGRRASHGVLTGGQLYVYGRAGKPCRVCGETLRVRRGKRLTVFCPRCQRPGT